MEVIVDQTDYQDAAVEPEIAELAKPKAKRWKKILVLVLILFFIIALLGSGAYWAFQKYVIFSPQVSCIGKDALIVGRGSLPRILLKADLDQLKKGDEDERLMEFLEKYNLDDLVKNPKKTGLISINHSYFFVEYDEKMEDFCAYIVMPLSSGKKFASFVKNIELDDDGFEVKERNKKWTLDFSEDDLPELPFSVTWSKNTLMMGFVLNTYSDSELLQARFKSIGKKVSGYLDQPRSASISSNPAYKKAAFRYHDLMLWSNDGLIVNVIEKGLKQARPRMAELIKEKKRYQASYNSYLRRKEAYDDYYHYGLGYYYENYYNPPTWDYDASFSAANAQNPFEKIMELVMDYDQNFDWDSVEKILTKLKATKGMSSLYYVDFKKGKLDAGFELALSDEQIRLFKDIFANSQSPARLAAYLPKEDLLMAFTLSFNMPALGKLFGKLPKEALDSAFNEIGGMLGYKGQEDLLKDFKKLCDGPVFATVNAGSGSRDEPLITLAMSVKNNNGIKTILNKLADNDLLEKDGKVYKVNDVAIFFKEDVLILTSNYKQYNKSELGLDKKQIARVDSDFVGCYLDFEAMQDSDMFGSQMNSSLIKAIRNYKISSKKKDDFPQRISFEINFSDKKANAFKTIVESMPNERELMNIGRSFPRKSDAFKSWQEQEELEEPEEPATYYEDSWN